MGKIIQLEAGDGHAFDAYRADPDGEARGGLVVMQAGGVADPVVWLSLAGIQFPTA